MMKTKYGFVATLLLGFGIAAVPTVATAAKFNSLISNPFVFCSAPKPCRHCHPFRKIYDEICSDQKNASKTEDRDPIPRTQDEIRAEIARLTPVLNYQTAVSTDAGLVLDQCVATNGNVQDGFCSAEWADYYEKQLPAIATLEEIQRLEALLKTSSTLPLPKPRRDDLQDLQ